MCISEAAALPHCPALHAHLRPSSLPLSCYHTQVLEHPQPDAVARPLDANLFIWHANLRLPVAEAEEEAGPHATERAAVAVAAQHLAGVPLHAVMVFPETYPTDGPEVRLFHALPHPNVYPHLASRE